MIDELTLKDNKNAKVSPMKSMQHVSLSGMKRKYSLHCPQFRNTGNSPEFSMHGGPVCGQGTDKRRWIVDSWL